MMEKKIDGKLFEAEEAVLQAATEDLADPCYGSDKVLPRYNFLVQNYRKLLKVTRKIFHISDIQGHVLQRHQLEMQNLLDNANQGFLTFGQDLQIGRLYSAESVRIFGRKIAGTSIARLLSQGNEELERQVQASLQRVFAVPEEQAMSELQQFPLEFRIGNKHVRVECKMILQPNLKDERMVVMMILTDITEWLQAEAKIMYLSYHDKLTGLYNRAYIEEILPVMESETSLPMSVIMADMNSLKLVNDVFGHQEGDALLIAAATVLKRCCRQTDAIIRWGGDEFLVLLPNTDAKTCAALCEQIQKACLAMDSYSIPLSLAVGMVTKKEGIGNLSELFSLAENNMYRNKLIESKRTRKIILGKLEASLISRCFENEGHTARIKKMALDFIHFLQLDDVSLGVKSMGKLAQFHDIGKVALPSEILGSTRALTLSEWDIMKSHSEIGYRMLLSIGEQNLADIILALHERWDGSGYPCGLAGESIPLMARLFAIVDCYDVITHVRPYKKTFDPAGALQEIEAGMGTQFDPHLVKHFLTYMRNNQ